MWISNKLRVCPYLITTIVMDYVFTDTYFKLQIMDTGTKTSISYV